MIRWSVSAEVPVPPGCLISLQEIMERFMAHAWMAASVALDQLGRLEGDSTLSDEDLANAPAALRSLGEWCRMWGWIASAATADKLAVELAKPPLNNMRLKELAREMLGRLEDEMPSTVFLVLSPSESARYQDS